MKNGRIRKSVVVTLVILAVGLSFILSFLSSRSSETEARDIPSRPVAPPSEPEFVEDKRPLTVDRGDTLTTLLCHQGIAYNDARAAIAALAYLYNPRTLKPGQEVALLYRHKHFTVSPRTFRGFELFTSAHESIRVEKQDNDRFSAHSMARNLIHDPRYRCGTITTSLYMAAMNAHTPPSVLSQMIHLFSFDIDFQRDIHTGDGFTVYYEQFADERGLFVSHGPVLFASLTVGDRCIRAYRHTTPDGVTDYYNEEGETVRKKLIRTPIDGARLTSGYGMRRHPILGYSRMHRGLDFAAPRGTPISAAGDGTITEMGWKGDYGNYIHIRHANGYATAYGHLKCFQRGLGRGSRVSQGDTIGYVGSTGLSTGPHLHYEVHYEGRKINPSRLSFPPERKLAGADRQSFLLYRATIDAERERIARKIQSSSTLRAINVVPVRGGKSSSSGDTVR